MNSFLAQVFDHPNLTGCLTIAVKTFFIYLFLIAGLRVLGKRELGQMNIYDLVLIVILGNAVQNAMMNNDNTLAGGLVAATVLLIMNRALNAIFQRSKKLSRAMVGEPVLIVNNGVPVDASMKHEGITQEQLLAALREHGMSEVSEAQMCVLEVDGTISVVPTKSDVFKTKRHFKALRLP